MEHASANVALEHDHVLAAFLEQGTLPEIARRVNMSLASLARWTRRHADLLNDLHQLLTARCKILAAHLECAALTALASVSNAPTEADDTRLRERALERKRRAASAILRHRTSLERTTRTRDRAQTPSHAQQAATDPAQQRRPVNDTERLAIDTNPQLAIHRGAEPQPPKPTLAERFAARRLAALTSEGRTPTISVATKKTAP